MLDAELEVFEALDELDATEDDTLLLEEALELLTALLLASDEARLDEARLDEARLEEARLEELDDFEEALPEAVEVLLLDVLAPVPPVPPPPPPEPPPPQAQRLTSPAMTSGVRKENCMASTSGYFCYGGDFPAPAAR
ncbi:hypothetical protein [Viridibacterium curvum]|uniref:Uncharacterized protein n=1 Tax=Viridibacterium curvum TaxID=1101404 RepID=A0ABP9QBQ0_9RHOO